MKTITFTISAVIVSSNGNTADAAKEEAAAVAKAEAAGRKFAGAIAELGNVTSATLKSEGPQAAHQGSPIVSDLTK